MKVLRGGYGTVSPQQLIRTETWREGASRSVGDILEDPIVSRLLVRSNMTRVQFETFLIDQLGHDMANKRLTREEMAQMMRDRKGISRGAFNRRLRQARDNVSEAIHTILLLGYVGMIESPSLVPLVEASEQLKSQVSQLRELSLKDRKLYRTSLTSLLDNLEEAFDALYGRDRDT